MVPAERTATLLIQQQAGVAHPSRLVGASVIARTGTSRVEPRPAPRPSPSDTLSPMAVPRMAAASIAAQ